MNFGKILFASAVPLIVSAEDRTYNILSIDAASFKGYI